MGLTKIPQFGLLPLGFAAARIENGVVRTKDLWPSFRRFDGSLPFALSPLPIVDGSTLVFALVSLNLEHAEDGLPIPRSVLFAGANEVPLPESVPIQRAFLAPVRARIRLQARSVEFQDLDRAATLIRIVVDGPKGRWTVYSRPAPSVLLPALSLDHAEDVTVTIARFGSTWEELWGLGTAIRAWEAPESLEAFADSPCWRWPLAEDEMQCGPL
jgi:hypothetical protein